MWHVWKTLSLSRVWCVQYLSLASTFEAKDSVCERLVGFLLGEECGDPSEERSFQLLEALLYRVHLNVFTGRMAAGLDIFQVRPRRFRTSPLHLSPVDHGKVFERCGINQRQNDPKTPHVLQIRNEACLLQAARHSRLT